MKTQKLLAVFLACLIFCQVSLAQTLTPPAEDLRVARLAGLAKVWGAVKYFHPHLAYRAIDWDKALIDTVPKVSAAKTAQEYEAAVNGMLAVLEDRSTRVEIEAKTAPDAGTVGNTDENPIKTENGIVVIKVAQIGAAVAKDNGKLSGFVTSVTHALPNAKGIVIDVRSAKEMVGIDQYYVGVFMRQSLSAMLDGNVVLGSTRYRQHNGYATQTSAGANFYSSSFLTSAPQVLQGQAKTKTPPIAFIVNEHSPAFGDVLSGLQAAGRAAVIQEGQAAPQSGGGTFSIQLPDGIKAQIRTTELIYPDGSVELQPDSVVANTNADDAFNAAVRAVQENKLTERPKRRSASFTELIDQKDNQYPSMELPTVEYRLLALFRFWNVINYFFPYKKLIDDPWENVLARYIPKFEANKDAVDYQLTVREMVAEIKD